MTSNMNKSINITNKGTIKKKEKKNLKSLWNKFDECIEEETPKYQGNNGDSSTIQESKINNTAKTQLECVYSNMPYDRENCEACKSVLSMCEEGFLICTNKKCGILYKDRLDQTAEWRYYGSGDNNSSDPTRCGMPINPLLSESSMGCKIVCSSRSSYEMRKLRRYTEWQSMPYKEKSQYEEFEHIKVMANNAGIPKYIIDDALYYHKIVSEQKTFRSLNRDGIIAASIYISGRINNFPRTAKEIAAIFHLDNTSATKGCKNAITIINQLEKNKEGDEKTTLHQTKPVTFIERYCSKLNMNKELTKLCMFLAMKIDKENTMPENTPHSVAAGIIYFVSQLCNLNITKQEVRSISEISEVTINKCTKKLEKIQHSIIPKAILEKYSS
jgi:transcription initiation factor TFIIB